LLLYLCLEDGYSISEPSERGDLVGSSEAARLGVLVGVLTRLTIISFYKLLNARPQIKNTNPRWKNSRLTVAAIVRVESKNVYDFILHMK